MLVCVLFFILKPIPVESRDGFSHFLDVFRVSTTPSKGPTGSRDHLSTPQDRGHCVQLHRIMPQLVHLIQAQQRRPLDAVIATGTRWFVKMQRMAVLVNPQRLIFLRPRCHSTCPKQSFVYTMLFVTCDRAVVNSKSPFHSNFATAASIAFQSGVSSKPMYG